MLIVNDLGTEIVNADQVFSFLMAPLVENGATVGFSVLAISPSLNASGPLRTNLCVGSKQRCEQALGAIRKGVKDRQHVVELLGILGARPDITVPNIILPGNGAGGPS